VTASWLPWALGSAGFAALTAILAKIGVSGVNPDFATLIRSVIIVGVCALFVTLTGQREAPGMVGRKTLVFLALSGLATGASWLCYFRALQLGEAARVAPVDKLSVVLVAVLGVTLLGEKLSATGWAGVALVGVGAVLVAVG
jgi:transporter family protein